MIEGLIAIVALGIAAIVCGWAWRTRVVAERRLRAALAVMPTGMAVFDHNDRLQIWNERYEAASGPCRSLLRKDMQFADMLRADLETAYYAEAEGRKEAWLADRLAKRAQCEGSHEQDIGGGRWLLVEDRRTADGGVVTSCTDITDLKQREESFKLMFDSNPVPMWLWRRTRELEILEVNQAGLDHLGYTREQVPGMTVFDLLDESEHQFLREMVGAGMPMPYKGERVWRPKRSNGETRFARPYIQLLPDPAGGPPRFLAAIVDVTEQVKAEDELRRSRDVAEAANRAKDAFLANMSHELRTPLNGVLGMADLLAGRALDDSEREMVTIIRGSASTLERLIGDILDLSRIEAGQVSIEQVPFDLEEAVRAVAGLVRPKAEEKGLALEVLVAPQAAGTWLGDACRIKQVLSTLAGNAVKFTEKGGVTVEAELEGSAVRLTVSDTGVGFDAADRERIFARFEQADASHTRKFGGSGLGLTIARDLVELMGGTIAAEGAPGKGATFTVVLPLTPAAAVEAAQPAAELEAGEEGERPLRILLVDDHPTNRKVVELILAGAGADADLVQVENGLEAVEAYQSQPFDLVLMDMQMPVMDGLTATAKIRELEAASGLPHAAVIMLTANALPEHVRAAMGAGADLHLAKPVSAPALLGAIGQTLEAVEALRAAA